MYKTRLVSVNQPLPDDRLDQNVKSHGIYLPVTRYPTNKIRTSKYSILTFIPKNLFEQFRRVANFFFLFLVILQLCPEYWIVSPIITAAPFVIICGLTAIKDGFEDFKRHRNDKKVNNRLTHILMSNKNYNYRENLIHWPTGAVSDHYVGFHQSTWQTIKVGDLVKVYDGENIPADLIILTTSETENTCFIETKNLDGETNLKLRQGPPETMKLTDFENLKCFAETELPNPSLQNFQGTLILTLGEGKQKRISIDLNGILLRGTVLKNTKFVVGFTFATGNDTKMILNSGETPSKLSEMEKLINKQIGFNFVLMIFICVICSVGSAVWNAMNKPVHDLYHIKHTNGLLNAFINFWSSLILYQNIVPISLYISLEIVKTIQAYFIHADIELYHEETDNPCVPRTWNLAENLGQIEYIFSDKTGTLTRNIMEFKKCSIGGVLYSGSSGTAAEISTSQSKRSLVIHTDWVEGSNEPKGSKSHGSLNVIERSWHDKKLDVLMGDQGYENTTEGRLVHLFFLCLALCHTVLIEEGPEQEVTYKAQSPDESCLVAMACQNGYAFVSRKVANGISEMTVRIKDDTFKFALLQILEFDSERKRMSVIVRDLSSSKVLIFCKGADSVIFDRLNTSNEESLKTDTNKHLEHFGESGLRTLCFGSRELPNEFYEDWSLKYQDAVTKVYQTPDLRKEALEVLHNEVETELDLLGATAIEDKLQEGVPACIRTLLRAKIKIWVLTGDKMETAINVGLLCGLLQGHKDVYQKPSSLLLIQIKSAKTPEDVETHLTTAKMKFWNQSIEALQVKSRNMGLNSGVALVIDGTSMKHVFESTRLSNMFLDVACRCETVICCRVSPLQKAQVVSLVKNTFKSVTLAIGDGANDISMIQEAHVGVGISGEEGLQAALSSDYAIAQFRFLSRLLLVHGRWSYSRNAFMMLNFTLKSLVFSLVIVWFQFYNGFSSSVQYEFTYLLFYNTIFTILPVIALAIFDRDLKDTTLLANPQLYEYDGIHQRLYSHKIYFFYILESFWQSLICFYIPFLTYYEAHVVESGFATEYLLLGTAMAVPAISVVNISVIMDTHQWVWIHAVVYIVYLLIFPVYVTMVGQVPASPINDFFSHMVHEPTFWFSVTLAILVSLAPRFLYYALTRQFRPTDTQILEELQTIRPVKETDLEKQAEKPCIEEPAVSDRRVSITEDAQHNQSLPNRGFSFTSTKGMGKILLRKFSSIRAGSIGSAGFRSKSFMGSRRIDK